MNSRTVVSALSEDGRPVTQSTMYPLGPGDVIQLEVMRGVVRETSNPEFSYTSFTGWLVSAPEGNGGFSSDRGLKIFTFWRLKRESEKVCIVRKFLKRL